MNKGEIKFEDRMKIFAILYPEAHWDAECYIDKAEWTWEEVLDEFHIPKYRTKAHFISELVEYIGETKQSRFKKDE